jgi:hypothetical protein
MNTTLILGLFGAVFASSGFWQFLQAKMQRKSPLEKAVLAMLHDRLMHLLACYMEMDEIEPEEFENLTELFEAYSLLGGNGTIKRMYNQLLNSVKIR